MKFSVGYKFFDENDEPFAEFLCKNAEHIDEVYFPWLDAETCRTSIVNERGTVNWSAQAFLENDLAMLKHHGIMLNLLLNANCYGERAVSKYLSNYICSIIEHIEEVAGSLDVVTTTSPFIAKVIKDYFPKIKTRASVNMRIGDIKGMQYMAELFDGFYIQRDFNRDLEHVQKIKKWATANGKTLHILVNSGCMEFCSGQTFHDNTVAHKRGINEIQNVDGFKSSICWDYYAKKGNWVSLLQNTWVRPEDLYHYEKLFDTVKLATRSTLRPKTVINAYIRGSYTGNLLDLFEPNHTKLLNNHYINNKKFPSGWFEKTSSCDGQCHHCNYCSQVLQQVITEIGEVTSY